MSRDRKLSWENAFRFLVGRGEMFGPSMMFFPRDDEKAPKGWRSPKPGGVLSGLWPSRQRLGLR